MQKGNKKIVKSATESLKLLWGKGFFRNWKNLQQIVERFARDGYHFSTPELGMALRRAKHLTRRGKRGHYEYIQKCPYTEYEE